MLQFEEKAKTEPSITEGAADAKTTRSFPLLKSSLTSFFERRWGEGEVRELCGPRYQHKHMSDQKAARSSFQQERTTLKHMAALPEQTAAAR